jgi:hypothetical protein
LNIKFGKNVNAKNLCTNRYINADLSSVAFSLHNYEKRLNKLPRDTGFGLVNKIVSNIRFSLANKIVGDIRFGLVNKIVVDIRFGIPGS